jgi:predicted ABC-type ATPase
MGKILRFAMAVTCGQVVGHSVTFDRVEARYQQSQDYLPHADEGAMFNSK